MMMQAAPHNGGCGVVAARQTASANTAHGVVVADAAGGVLAYEDLNDVALYNATTHSNNTATMTAATAAAPTTTMRQSKQAACMLQRKMQHEQDEAHNEQQQPQQQGQLVVVGDRRMHNVLMPFAGFYEDVTYPVATLYAPPQPPSALPPRQCTPPARRQRLAAVAAAQRSLAQAGARENRAQCVVSKVWRGVLSRRQLHNDRTYQHILHARARMIQCWWRSRVALREAAARRAIKQAWLHKRAADFVDDRLAGMSNMMKWQQRRYETAAQLLQRVVRWFLRRRACAAQPRRGEAESEGALPLLPFPLPRRVPTYFPWRQRQRQQQQQQQQQLLSQQQASTKGKDSGGSTSTALVAAHASSSRPSSRTPQRRRTLLEFRKTRSQGGSGDSGDGSGEGDAADAAAPLPLETVERMNANMRRRTRNRLASLCDPAAVQRQSWKRDNLRRDDLDFNAGVIQRAYRARRATTKLTTREVTTTYMNKVVRTLVRAFRMYALVQRLQVERRRVDKRVREAQLRYSRDRIAHIDHELVWGKELMNCCAMTIQRCWRWHYYTRTGIVPPRPARNDHNDEQQPQQQLLHDVVDGDALPPQQHDGDSKSGDDDDGLPTPPPYGLLTEHMRRQRELRLSRMTLQERNLAAMQQRRTCTHFTPAQVNVRKRVGCYITA